MLIQCSEDLQNSSTISYPTRKLFLIKLAQVYIDVIDLAESTLRIAQTWLQNLKDSALSGSINAELNKAAILYCHHLTESLVSCSAAAYTASIEHYERMFLLLYIF